MGDITDFSTTDANNNQTPPDGFPEFMNYRNLNDSARAVMGAIARNRDDTQGVLASAGTPPAYTLTTNRNASIATGLVVAFRAHASNGGFATTLAVDGNPALSVLLDDGSDPNIVAGGVYVCVNDGSNWQITSCTQPQRSIPTFTSETVSRDLVPSDVNGNYIQVTASSDLTFTIANSTTYPSGRIILFPRDGFNIILQNNKSSWLIRSNTSSGDISGVGSGTFGNRVYTLIITGTTNNYMLEGLST